MPNVIGVIRIWRPKFILWCDVRHQEVQRERHELAERHGADCTALEVSHMLFERCHTKNRKKSVKHHLKYFNFWCKIQSDQPLDMDIVLQGCANIVADLPFPLLRVGFYQTSRRDLKLCPWCKQGRRQSLSGDPCSTRKA